MSFVLVFAIYVLKNWKLSATPRNGFATPLGVATHRLGTAGGDGNFCIYLSAGPRIYFKELI